MTARSLPGDIARCAGIGSDEEGWYEECETCLRRTAAPSGHPWQSHMGLWDDYLARKEQDEFEFVRGIKRCAK